MSFISPFDVALVAKSATEAVVSGRKQWPLYYKLFPVWWFLNSGDQPLSDATWYHPEWPEWRRELIWNVFRNPLRNLLSFVIGVRDKNYQVVGKAPILTVQRNDLRPPENGFQWCKLYGGDLWFSRYFLSYSGVRFVWQIGWQPNGHFGAKFNW